jgi:hypothetical protein
MMYHISDSRSSSITIRAARPKDERAIRRLAQRDSRPVPDGELLTAFVDGQVRAALSLTSGEAIADPFHRTDELVSMLALRRSELRALEQSHRGKRLRDALLQRRRPPAEFALRLG